MKMTMVAGIPLPGRKPNDIEKLKIHLTKHFKAHTLKRSFELRTMPHMKCYKISHTGPYRHLGNAWARGITMVRTREIDVDRKHATFELYNTHPRMVKNEDLETKTD